MKRNAVVLGFTSNFAFAVACVIMDMRKLSKNKIDQYILYHDGLSKRDARLLKQLGDVRLVKYDFPLEGNNFSSAKVVKHFTKMVFSKFECFKLLGEFENVMWLDFDIVIRKDISYLLEKESKGLIAAPANCTVLEQLYEPVQRYDMNKPAMFGGTFVLQRKIGDWKLIHDFCYSELRECIHTLKNGEQAIFDFVNQKFLVVPEWIDTDEFASHPNDSRDASILHAYGQPKFWNGITNLQWEENYSQWIRMGGNPYKPPTRVSVMLNKLGKKASKWLDMNSATN